MQAKHIKGAVAAIALLGAGWLGLMIYAMTEMEMTQLVLCSAGKGGTRIPSAVCEYYMKHHRGSEKDMQELAIGGLDPILNIDSDRKYEFAEFLISKGLDVNGVNRYGEPSHVTTPLHASVLYNDIHRAKFLLAHGADPNIKIKSRVYNDLTALELAKAMQQRLPTEDRSELIRLLSAAATAKKALRK